MKNSQLIMVTVLLSVVCMSYSHTHDDVLKPLHDKIKDKFINRSSAYIARQMKKNKPVSQDFQHFLENDESMKIMKQSYGDGGEFSFIVASKKNEIINEFEHKRDELYAENETNFYKKLASEATFCISASAEVLGLGMIGTNGSRAQSVAGIGISVGALVAGVVSWITWSWAIEAQKEKQIHVAEVVTMKEKLSHDFEVLQKSTEHKHAHPHTTTTTYN